MSKQVCVRKCIWKCVTVGPCVCVCVRDSLWAYLTRGCVLVLALTLVTLKVPIKVQTTTSVPNKSLALLLCVQFVQLARPSISCLFAWMFFQYVSFQRNHTWYSLKNKDNNIRCYAEACKLVCAQTLRQWNSHVSGNVALPLAREHHATLVFYFLDRNVCLV